MNSEKSRDARQNEANRGQGAQFVGKSVEDALNQAAAEYGVPVAQLDFEVIKDTTFSILGFVRKGEAVVRVWPSAEAVASQPGEPAAAESEEAEAEPAAQIAAPQPAVQPRPAATTQPVAQPRPAAAAPVRILDEDGGESPEGPQGNPPELEDVAIEVLSTLLDKMDLIAAVEVVDQGGVLDPESNEVSPMVLNAVGDELGVLIGRRGETLRDLQFITRLIISRQLGVWPNVIVDVEGYKEKRATSLRALAVRMADEVRRTRRPAVLEPMPAYERRIVHLTLRNDPDVYTESTGEEEHRKVQILPR